MSQSFESIVHAVDDAWRFDDRKYRYYPKHAVAQQEFELKHCANHIGAAAGRVHAHLERIDHEGIDSGIAIELYDDLAKLLGAALKMSQVLKISPDDLAKAMTRSVE
jgi:hypothetical protein